jgi:general secretion pathway protein I
MPSPSRPAELAQTSALPHRGRGRDPARSAGRVRGRVRQSAFVRSVPSPPRDAEGVVASARFARATVSRDAGEGRRGSRADRAAGFTLIEILVAFTIVALMLGALYQLFATGLRSGATAENYESAVLIAQSGLDALNGAPLALGENRQQLGRFERQTTVAPRADLLSTEALSVPMLYELTVRVSWREGVRQRFVTLSTLRAGPRDLR